MTISESLNGTPFSEYPNSYVLDTKTGIWTFPDNSRAVVMTRIERCEPYIEMGVTKSFKEVKFWRSL